MEANQQNKQASKNITRDMEIKNKLTVTRGEGQGMGDNGRGRGEKGKGQVKEHV